LTPIETLVAVGLKDGLGIRELAEDCPCSSEELLAVVRRLESIGEVELRDTRRASMRELSAVIEGEVDDDAWSAASALPAEPDDPPADEDEDDADAHDRPTRPSA
jgi:hypothetical protein